MNETWKKWEGRVVEERYPLQTYLGGSGSGAVFLTSRRNASGAEERAAIKLVPARSGDSEAELGRWKKIADLRHPNLLAIVGSGRCNLDGTALLYVVMEYAEENLGQVVPERALTSEETQGMLPPVLRALQYVHERGLVHGRIRPSNIVAVGDSVKISSDSLVPMGEVADATPADDIAQLGTTLVEVLTQHRPDPNAEISSGVAEPFRRIASKCLHKDPAQRPTAGAVLQWIETGKSPARHHAAANRPSPNEGRQSTSKWLYAGGVAAALAIGGFLLTRPKPTATPVRAVPVASRPGTAADTVQPAALKSAIVPQSNASTGATAPVPNDDVVKRVMPDVSAGARRTIHGTIPVKVKVKVDADGDVVKAKVESGRASKYFKRLALEAAQDWKFTPAQGDHAADREWKLQFAFSRSKVEASAVRAR